MIKHKVPWLFGYDGFTIGEHVFLTEKGYNNERLLKHEQAHIDQYKRDGLIRFMLNYVWLNIQYGYENNPYEIEARQKEGT